MSGAQACFWPAVTALKPPALNWESGISSKWQSVIAKPSGSTLALRVTELPATWVGACWVMVGGVWAAPGAKTWILWSWKSET